MSKLHEYPYKLVPHDDDLILISDSEDGLNTKQIKFSTVSTSGNIAQPVGYKVLMPQTVGTAGQVLALPTPIGTSPYQLVWANNTGSSQNNQSSNTVDSTTITADSSTVTADAA